MGRVLRGRFSDAEKGFAQGCLKLSWSCSGFERDNGVLKRGSRKRFSRRCLARPVGEYNAIGLCPDLKNFDIEDGQLNILCLRMLSHRDSSLLTLTNRSMSASMSLSPCQGLHTDIVDSHLFCSTSYSPHRLTAPNSSTAMT